MTRASISFGLVVASLLPACAADEPVDEFADETAADGEEGKGDAAGAFTFLVVEADTRQCPTNHYDCGVVYTVRRANRSTIQCGRGASENVCSVASIDWSATSLPRTTTDGYENLIRSGEPMVLRGGVLPSADDSVLSVAATEVWKSPTKDVGDGVFVLVTDNLCDGTAPCPELFERKLNSNLSSPITGVDFRETSAAKWQINAAREEYNGHGLLVQGRRGESDGGKFRTATKWFVRAD